jgi:transposase
MAARKRYTEQFKDEACRLVTERGYTQRRVTTELGLGHYTLRDWLRERRDREAAAAAAAAAPAPADDDPEALRVQVRELRRQVERLELEREILKKATAFFASQGP